MKLISIFLLISSDVGPYDIGLIKLQTPLVFTKEVQPIALPEPGSIPTGDAILCGWGSTSESWIPDMPNELQHVNLHYLDLQTCDENVERLTGSSPVHETNVCTGPTTGGISACSVRITNLYKNYCSTISMKF